MTVRRVVLDVVVKDAHGNAVHGLRKKDFIGLRKQQAAGDSVVREVRLQCSERLCCAQTATDAAGHLRECGDGAGNGPLYVIVYDAVHMEFDPRIRGPGRSDSSAETARHFLASKPAGTRFALFLLGSTFGCLQGFTTDKNKLLEAFDVHRKGSHIPNTFLKGANFGKDDAILPFEVMAFLGHYLEGLPGRKNLIWMSSQFPVIVPMFGIQAARTWAT